jgi:hypothetical protein
MEPSVYTNKGHPQSLVSLCASPSLVTLDRPLSVPAALVAEKDETQSLQEAQPPRADLRQLR